MTVATTSSPHIRERQTEPEPRGPLAVPYSLALGYLRASITVLVVLHHAVLAYHPYAPPPPTSLVSGSQWWRAFPIVDSRRWTGFSLLVGFNDIFFMSLMFFLSGLFVWDSLRRKGTATFLRDRVLRLGIPFAAAVLLVAPLAYYPTYLQSTAHPAFADFRRQWFALSDWPSGPAWFVWVLLAFGGVAAFFFQLIRAWAERCGRWLSHLSERPARFFVLLIAVSAVTYVPMALVFNPFRWSAFGPFTFQTSRIFHYLAYYLIAAGLGACGLGRGLLSPDGKLARRWLVWALSALGAFALATTIAIIAISSGSTSQSLAAVGGLSFVLSCAASSFAFLAFFLRFARSRVALLDSLRENAYGIYLVHYAFVSWLQYALLGSALPAIAKGSLVFLGALALSWSTIAIVRRVPVVARLV